MFLTYWLYFVNIFFKGQFFNGGNMIIIIGKTIELSKGLLSFKIRFIKLVFV